MFACSALTAAIASGKLFAYAPPRPQASSNPIMMLGAAILLLLAVGLLRLIIKGIPKLTVDASGLTLRNLFGTKSA